MTITIQEVIAVVGVLSAFLTALVSLIGLRWNKQALEVSTRRATAELIDELSEGGNTTDSSAAR